MTRRAVLLGTPLALAGSATAASARVAQVDVGNGLLIRPRSSWAEGLAAPAGLPVEASGDVRVLLVHHSATGNAYAEADVPSLIRSFHSLHTSPDKGWPDVAYNFFVDRFGSVWEGRIGSIDGPVIGSATGGNQGFSQLVCLIGDFQVEPPTPEAVASLTSVLGWMAQRYGVDPAPGATTEFVSRGSNRWPVGATVSTSTIAGHRDMSSTVCPGDAAYRFVADGSLASAVQAETRERTPPPTTIAVPSTSVPVTAGPEPTAASTTSPSSEVAAQPTASDTAAEASSPSESSVGSTVPLIAAGAAAVAVLGGLALRGRRRPAGLRIGAAAAPGVAASGGTWSVNRTGAVHRIMVVDLGERLLLANPNRNQDVDVITRRLGDPSLRKAPSTPDVLDLLADVEADVVVLGEDRCSMQTVGAGWLVVRRNGQDRVAPPERTRRRQLDLATADVSCVALIDAGADAEAVHRLVGEGVGEFDAAIAHRRSLTDGRLVDAD